MIWVIDASALIRLFIPDGPLHPEVESALERAGRGEDLVLAPHLLLVEAANVLLRKRRRGELSYSEMIDLTQVIASLPIRFCDHAPPLLSACALAEQHGLTAYDAHYLALAEQHGARLITHDANLAQAAQRLARVSPGASPS